MGPGAALRVSVTRLCLHLRCPSSYRFGDGSVPPVNSLLVDEPDQLIAGSLKQGDVLRRQDQLPLLHQVEDLRCELQHMPEAVAGFGRTSIRTCDGVRHHEVRARSCLVQMGRKSNTACPSHREHINRTGLACRESKAVHLEPRWPRWFSASRSAVRRSGSGSPIPIGTSDVMSRRHSGHSTSQLRSGR